MDDYHGRMKLNLIYHQLPPCPYVVHVTIENFVVIIYILIMVVSHWLMNFPGASRGGLGSDVLDANMWLNPRGLQVALFHSSKNCHVAYPSWFYK